MKTLHYKAFISYSHQDEAWASGLQKALENYRVPKRLVGRDGLYGVIPERLSPVFRDREDLSSSSDLTSNIRGELAASETLVVICSPAAARSRWVNEEIRYFRELGRGDRILAMIVDGDPQSSDPAQQCFPSALLQNPDGSRHEPMAADARKYADGKTLSKLKLVAGILGIRLDELRRRDAQRRRRNLAAITLGVLGVVAVTAWLAFTAITTKHVAQRQKVHTEELLSYMLGNLKSLDPIEGLEVIDENDEQVMTYLETLGFAAMDNALLVDTALEWRQQGQDLHARRQLDEAARLFAQSRSAFIELHRREQGSKRSLFELGQAEFYVGYIHLEKGELDEAQLSFTRYGAITRRLVNADPNNAEMVMELAYTLINLSVLERSRQSPDVDKALQLTQSAMQYIQIALVLDPDNFAYRRELSIASAFLADAWQDLCNLGKAFEFRRQNVDLSRQLSAESPENDELLMELAYALSGLAKVQREMSLTGQALEGLEESRLLLRQLAERAPDNRTLQWNALLRKHRAARILTASGQAEQVWDGADELLDETNAVFEQAGSTDFTAAVEYATFQVTLAALANRMGEPARAQGLLESAVQRLISLVREKPENRSSRYELARASFEYWQVTGQLPREETGTLLKGYLADPNSVQSCEDTSLAARLAFMHGNIQQAKDYTSYLLERGYYDPEFIGFCKQNQICD